jgi:hypothetical protein
VETESIVLRHVQICLAGSFEGCTGSSPERSISWKERNKALSGVRSKDPREPPIMVVAVERKFDEAS